MSYSEETFRRVRELYESGYTYKEICKELSLKISVVIRIINILHNSGMKKRHSSLDSDDTIRRSKKAHELTARGLSVTEAIKIAGCSRAAYYDWKSGYIRDKQRRK